MQDQLAGLDATEHHPRNMDGAVVPEPSLRVERDKVEALEAEMAAMPQVQFLTDHHLFAGCYYRSILVPAGCALTGAVHLHANILCLVRGKAYILNGPEPQLVEAPWCGVGPAGTKRVGLAIEDCVFLSALATPHTEVAKIEQENVVATYKEYDERIQHELCYHGSSDCRSGDGGQRPISQHSGQGQPEGSGRTDQAEQGQAGGT